jgi:hypothetical protein
MSLQARTYTAGMRVRMVGSELPMIRPGHLGTVVLVLAETTFLGVRLPWPVYVRFDGRENDTPCSPVELELAS